MTAAGSSRGRPGRGVAAGGRAAGVEKRPRRSRDVRRARAIGIALVGLGFGAEFLPIYQRHPLARVAAICQRSARRLDAVGEAFGVERRYTDFRALLRDPDVDAVHINTPIPDHAWMTLAALRAGKHVACTVPMATSIADCRRIVALQRRTGLVYMMMETVVWGREYLYMKSLLDRGRLGRLQFVQASHQQDMDGWPGEWAGLPPMWYATHCIGPVAGLVGRPAESVSCVGSGAIRKALAGRYGSPFAVESAHVSFRGSDVKARIVRSLFDTARQYRESIDVYGSRRSVEWPLVEHEPLVLHTAKRPEPRIPSRVKAPDAAGRLPRAIRRFTTQGVYDLAGHGHLSFTQGAGHGGSHPHLVHEFLSALAERRAPFPDARQAANWTCTGLCAHESALKGGVPVRLPAFTIRSPRGRR
jgi:predicted dehydrogenase